MPLRPKPARGFDALMLGYVVLISALMLAMIGMAIFASFATYWPYNLDAEPGSTTRWASSTPRSATRSSTA